MKTYYFGAVAISDSHTIRSAYAVDATHFDAASREVQRQTEWLWSHPDYSFQLSEFCAFGFARLAGRLQVQPIVLGRTKVPA